MTPQEKVLLLGIAGAAVTKFYFGKSWSYALTVGLAAITVHDVLTAKE